MKAPRSWPNSSLSASSRGSAPQLTATNGPPGFGPELVQRARHQLLAGAALARDQHRRRRRRHQRRARQRRPQRGIVSDDRAERRPLVSLASHAHRCRRRAPRRLRSAAAAMALTRPRPTQASPLSPISFFQIGARCFRRSIAARQASKAGARCCAAAAMATAISPTASAPDAVVDGDAHAGPLALDLLGDLAEHLLGHLDGRPRTPAGRRRAGGGRGAGRSPAKVTTPPRVAARRPPRPPRRSSAARRGSAILRGAAPPATGGSSASSSPSASALRVGGHRAVDGDLHPRQQRRHRRVTRRDRRARVAARRRRAGSSTRLVVEPEFARAARRNRELRPSSAA